MWRLILRLVVAGLLLAGSAAIGAGGFLASFILLLRMDIVERPLPMLWLGGATAAAVLIGLVLALVVDRRAFRHAGR